MLWLNEDSPTFLAADPPATPGEDRFRLDFRIDAAKRLTVSAFDLTPAPPGNRDTPAAPGNRDMPGTAGNRVSRERAPRAA